jgi:hypothetical protein
MKVKKACVRIIILLAIFCSDSQSKAQTFIWDAGFNGFFDNREYYHEFAKPQTLFGVRTYALAGATLHENYSIGIGLDALDEFGSKIRGEDICPIIFFRYQKDPLKFLFGSFHRKGLSILPYALKECSWDSENPGVSRIFG